MYRSLTRLSFLLAMVALVAVSASVVSVAQSAPASVASSSRPAAVAPAPYDPAAAAFATPRPAAPVSSSQGPDPDRKWEFEIHGGGTLSMNPGDGTAALPAAATPFTTALFGGGSSRQVPSWFFGDGAVLFNQVESQEDVGVGGFMTQRMVALDPVLNTQSAERDHAASFGFRISRDLTPRWALEANFDYSLANLSMNRAALNGIEASRAAWQAAFIDLFTNSCGCPNTVLATSNVHASDGQQVFGTLGVNFNLTTHGRFVPYVSFGGGAIGNAGGLPSAVLVGNYQALVGIQSYNETDSVRIHYAVDDITPTGYFGAGFKYYVTPTWGFRMDVRDYLSGNGVDTLVDASPSRVAVAAGTGVPTGPPFDDPTIQFSNDPSLVSPANLSSLSGSLTNFRTFGGSGVHNQVAVTVGVFLRF